MGVGMGVVGSVCPGGGGNYPHHKSISKYFRGPFYEIELISMPAWMSYYMSSIVWHDYQTSMVISSHTS